MIVLCSHTGYANSVVLLMHQNSRNTIAPACVFKWGEGGGGLALARRPGGGGRGGLLQPGGLGKGGGRASIVYAV